MNLLSIAICAAIMLGATVVAALACAIVDSRKGIDVTRPARYLNYTYAVVIGILTAVIW